MNLKESKAKAIKYFHFYSFSGKGCSPYDNRVLETQNLVPAQNPNTMKLLPKLRYLSVPSLRAQHLSAYARSEPPSHPPCLPRMKPKIRHMFKRGKEKTSSHQVNQKTKTATLSPTEKT